MQPLVESNPSQQYKSLHINLPLNLCTSTFGDKAIGSEPNEERQRLLHTPSSYVKAIKQATRSLAAVRKFWALVVPEFDRTAASPFFSVYVKPRTPSGFAR